MRCLPGDARVADRLDQLAHVVDRGAARRVDLLHVRRGAAGDLDARGADAAGRRGRALLAVEAARQDARDGGLADAARTAEQHRVRDAAHRDRIAQRGGDVLLAAHFGEALGSPFSRENLVAQCGGTLAGAGTSLMVLRSASPRCARRRTGACGAPRQDRRAPHPPLVRRCRCSLPGLTGFTKHRARAGPCDHASALRRAEARVGSGSERVKRPLPLRAHRARGMSRICKATLRSG